MKFRIGIKISLAILSTFFLQVASAQIYVEQKPGQQHVPATVSVYGPDASKKKIPLNRIRGSQFWNEEWQLASIFDKDANRISIVQGRMNLATGEFHFMWKDEELVAGDNKISLIIFHNNNDSSSIGTMFIKNMPNLVLNKKPLTAFVQIMNSGNCQLLKYTHREAFPAEDSLFGTQKRYVFRDINYYFLKEGDKVEKIKKLNDENFLALIPEASSYKEWINQNNLSFKKEEDVLIFLDYYNSRDKSSDN